MVENNEKQMEFVLKHYQDGRFDPEKGLKRFKSNKRKSRWGYYVTAVAAAAVVLVVLFNFSPIFSNEVVLIASGSKETFILPDSSIVTLSEGGSLSYNKRGFSKNERRLFLSGKGYFDVTKNPSKPFIVATENGFVKVLGTEFLLEDWPVARVYVYDGKVLFSKSEKSQGVILEKGEGALLPKGGIKPNILEKGGENAIAWMRGTFVFNNTPLKEVLLVLGNYYGVSFGATDLKKRLTGEFGTEDLDLIVTTIESALDVKIVKM